MVLKRIVGVLLLLIGILGIGVCAVGIYYTWNVARAATQSADGAIGLLIDTVSNVQDTLDVATSTLDNAEIAMGALYTTTTSVGDTLRTTRPTLDGMADLADRDLRRSLDSTLKALDTVQETAVIIDSALRTFDALGLAAYDPEVPLNLAVEDIGSGLKGVPESLEQMGQGLRQTGESLGGVETGINLMGDQVLAIQKNVGSANQAIGGFGDLASQLRSQMTALRQTVAQPIRSVAWGVTVLLVWVGLAHLAWLLWGVRLLTVSRMTEVQPA